MQNIIQVDNLTKKYGDVTAVNGVSFAVARGEVFGILGPNGAGKTTTVEMIEGLRRPDSGSIKVCNIDALKEADRIKQVIGVQLQATSIYDNIHVREAIDLFGGYYRKSVPTAEILEEISLTDKSESRVSALSGGQKQRLSVGLALVNDPEVLFLDEPTTGLDPQARHNIWNIVEKLQERGKTIVMTTHYMEEAEHLCQRLAIIDAGKIIAMDTPENLINQAGLDTSIEFSTSRRLNGIGSCIPGLKEVANGGAHKYEVKSHKVASILKDLTNLCFENNIELENIAVRKVTLEDVFLAMTGRKLRE
ncbi:MAG: ABC transporter ATP-binding protein [Dehalococcoidales bacterium]